MYTKQANKKKQVKNRCKHILLLFFNFSLDRIHSSEANKSVGIRVICVSCFWFAAGDLNTCGSHGVASTDVTSSFADDEISNLYTEPAPELVYAIDSF